MKNVTDIATKHGFVGAGFKPAQGVSGANQVNFPPQGGFETRPTTTCGFFIVQRIMAVSVKKQKKCTVFCRSGLGRDWAPKDSSSVVGGHRPYRGQGRSYRMVFHPSRC